MKKKQKIALTWEKVFNKLECNFACEVCCWNCSELFLCYEKWRKGERRKCKYEDREVWCSRVYSVLEKFYRNS